MKKRSLFMVPMFMLSLLGIPATSQSISAPDFVAVLDGENQVPRRETPATGKAVFRVNTDYKKIEYQLTVNNIDNVVAAHVHFGKPGEDGPIVATLVGPLPPGKGRKDGVLVEGSFQATDLRGPLWPGAEGTWLVDDLDVLFAELVSTLRSGGAYVNIRTDFGWGGPRPGNFTDGEIRGQILQPPKREKKNEITNQ